MTFQDFQLDSDVLEGIRSMGYKNPTPIQQQAIPFILDGSDLIACAQTGTGKTAAFILPILQKIVNMPAEGINTLVLVPTRELAIQIDQQVDAMSFFIDVRSIAVYGGGSGITWAQQQKALKRGTDIIVATPGRLIAQMQMGGLDFSKLKHLILDEADRMLDMGFLDDILQIVRQLPEERQTLCFSATMPPKIRSLSKRILKNPKEISIAVSQPAQGITQIAYRAFEEQKLQKTEELLKERKENGVLIFASSKEKVKQLERRLKKHAIEAQAFHSDLSQEEREAIMQDFKNHKISVLVGTDILSRGIDVTGIDLVINFDVPHDAEDYIHRIGRTARAENTGTAITFVSDKDERKFQSIQRLLKKKVELLNLDERYGPAPTGSSHQPKYTGERRTRSGHPKQSPRKKHKTTKPRTPRRLDNKNEK